MLQDRTSEWFVPKFGSRNFRVTIGLLFLPYTSIVTCFAAWGSLSGQFEVERTIAICVIYFLAVGISNSGSSVRDTRIVSPIPS